MNQLCPTPHGIERETSGIAEHIEHTLTTSESFEQWTVLALIDEEACLLTTQPVDIELQTVLEGDVIVASTIEEAVLHVVHEW